MASNPLTLQGANRLKEELHHLKTVERRDVIDAIATARAQGDLSENAEYDAARERQGFVEGRIQELESIISTANIINPAELNVGEKIVFGAFVTLEDLDSEEQVTYQIVGDIESDINENRISVMSPVARALINKTIGDVVVVRAPSGEREYEVLEIEYR